MGAMASQITSLTIVYSTVYSGTDEKWHQSSASLAFVRGICRWPVNSPHKGPVTRKMFLFDDVIMIVFYHIYVYRLYIDCTYVCVCLFSFPYSLSWLWNYDNNVFFFFFFSNIFIQGITNQLQTVLPWSPVLKNRSIFTICMQNNNFHIIMIYAVIW